MHTRHWSRPVRRPWGFRQPLARLPPPTPLLSAPSQESNDRAAVGDSAPRALRRIRSSGATVGAHMKRSVPVAVVVMLVGAPGVTSPSVTTTATAAPPAPGGTREIPSAGTPSIRAGALGPQGLQQPEI